jgi:hypothetical protein
MRKSAMGRTLFVGMMIVALGAVLGASSAIAAPTGEYSVFAQCPLGDASLDACIYAKTETGKFVVGNEEVPITNPVTLQGGFTENEATGELVFSAAANGETLTKAPQKVPGGLLGLVKCNEISNLIERIACEIVFENGVTGVNATTELAAPASSIYLNEANLLSEEGTALTLPVKVRLENPFLGSGCYIGSNASPIELNLTTGATSPPPPNKSIHGSKGTKSFNSEFTILTLSKNSLVNNSFAAPGASGCGGLFAPLIDPIIDAKLGLPAAAGRNTAVLNGTLKQASAESVREHD